MIHPRFVRRFRRTARLLLPLLAAPLCGEAADTSVEWKYEQALGVPQAGLLKLSLPAETLGNCRPSLEDLRLLDPSGREVPYAVERTQAAAPVEQAARSFAVALKANATVLLLETGLRGPLDGVRLSTPARAFIKAVRVEGSDDQTRWEPLGQGVPIFRQAFGADQLRVPVPSGAYRWLRLTVDDVRTAPVPFTGATVYAAANEPPTATVLAPIVERAENLHQTRLRVSLPAANLPLASVEIDATDAVFTRQVTVATRESVDGTMRETPLAQGVVYRLTPGETGTCSNLTVRVEKSAATRDLILLIDNQDSPPLAVLAVRIHWRPVQVVFHAAQAGAYRLLAGNPLCPAPQYDVAALGANLRNVPVAALRPTPLTNNPAYRPAPTLPAVGDLAGTLDTAAWKHRRSVGLVRPGAQQLELDLPALAHAQTGLGDLRLLRGTNQVPYLLEMDFGLRSFNPAVQPAPDSKRPKVSRWQIKLPQARLPIARLECTSPTPLFQRAAVVYEEAVDRRGEPFRRTLGQADWRQTPDQPAPPLAIELTAIPETDTLWLETDNGDNPAIELAQLTALHPSSRLRFKSDRTDGLWLYYGNADAVAPRYDLQLVAGQLLAAEAAAASLGPEERLQKASWREQFGDGGQGGPLIWTALIGVVAVLLVLVARLLPKSAGNVG